MTNEKIKTNHLSAPIKSLFIGESILSEELKKISRFCGAEAPEVIAFYAGRIVEAMTSAALGVFRVSLGEGGVKDKIDILQKRNLIDAGTASIAHAIRRYGNQVRHLERAVHPSEEETIIGLLQIWIEWFDLMVINNKAAKTEVAWSLKTKILRQLAYPEADETRNYLEMAEHFDTLLAEAALAEFAAERLVDTNSPLAERFTKKAMDVFPKSLRSRQIRALYFSRNNNPDGTIQLLSNWQWRPDRETIGILGGAYKNKWIEFNEPGYLEKAHQQYSKGVDFFPTDHYLRINLAATSLWKGMLSEARSHAHKTVQLLAENGFIVNIGDSCEGLDYWVVATLAEATLLSGKAKRANYLYQQAKSLNCLDGRWTRTFQQLSLHLRYLPKNCVIQIK